MAQFRFASFTAKDPSEKKDYSFVWTKELERTRDSISSSVWEITGAGLTQSSSPVATNDAQTTTVWFEAGTAGTDYIIVNRITTTQGRTHEASAILPCRDAG